MIAPPLTEPYLIFGIDDSASVLKIDESMYFFRYEHVIFICSFFAINGTFYLINQYFFLL